MKKRKYAVGVVLADGTRQTIAAYTRKDAAARMYKVLRRIADTHPLDVSDVWQTVAK